MHLSTAPVADRSAEIEFSGDYDFSYISTFGEATYNHVIALGRGEQENRLVRHVWLLPDGSMTSDPNAAGIPSGEDEKTLVYDYSSAEDEKELIKGAKKQLKQHGAQNGIEISFDSGDLDLPLGDRVGLRDRITPSDILRIDDGYAAYCFDEACCFIISQLEDGKRPFFTRRQQEGHSQHSGNARTIDILKKLGAEVKGID